MSAISCNIISVGNLKTSNSRDSTVTAVSAQVIRFSVKLIYKVSVHLIFILLS